MKTDDDFEIIILGLLEKKLIEVFTTREEAHIQKI